MRAFTREQQEELRALLASLPQSSPAVSLEEVAELKVRVSNLEERLEDLAEALK